MKISIAGKGGSGKTTISGTLARSLHELPSDDGMVVVDTETSPEHLSRATTEAVDMMLVVAEPYFKSLETARRYSGLGKDLGIPRVAVIANKVRDERDREAIEEFCRTHEMDLFGVVGFDDTLGMAEREGVAPVDRAPGSPAMRAIGEFAERVAGG